MRHINHFQDSFLRYNKTIYQLSKECGVYHAYISKSLQAGKVRDKSRAQAIARYLPGTHWMLLMEPERKIDDIIAEISKAVRELRKLQAAAGSTEEAPADA